MGAPETLEGDESALSFALLLLIEFTRDAEDEEVMVLPSEPIAVATGAVGEEEVLLRVKVLPVAEGSWLFDDDLDMVLKFEGTADPFFVGVVGVPEAEDEALEAEEDAEPSAAFAVASAPSAAMAGVELAPEFSLVVA